MWSEMWGTMVWGSVSVPLLGPLGLLVLGALLGTTATVLGRTRPWVARAAASLGIVVVPLVAIAASVPNTFVNGTVADADEVNANFSALVGSVSDLENVAGPGGDHIEWLVRHGAASAACAAASPQNDSTLYHSVIPYQAGNSCATSCATHGGARNLCRTSIAVGSLTRIKATQYGEVVGENYRYSCDRSFPTDANDEVLASDTSGYSAYCCCYGP